MSAPRQDSEAPSVAPTVCPFCHATTIKSPGEKADAGAYWRCEACGEMWNLTRQETTSSRQRYNPRWK